MPSLCLPRPTCIGVQPVVAPLERHRAGHVVAAHPWPLRAGGAHRFVLVIAAYSIEPHRPRTLRRSAAALPASTADP
jgi:hypothetical protein